MGSGLSVMVAAASVFLTLAAICCALPGGAGSSALAAPCGCRLLAPHGSAYPVGQGKPPAARHAAPPQ